MSFTSVFKLFLSKVQSKWSNPYKVVQWFNNGAIKLDSEDGFRYIITGKCVIHYYELVPMVDILVVLP